MTDYLGPDGGKLGMAFASGCTATWIFVRNLVMKPAIKSCHAQIADLRERMKDDKAECDSRIDDLKAVVTLKDARIAALETALFTSGIPTLRAAMQGVVSEARVAADKAEGKP